MGDIYFYRICNFDDVWMKKSHSLKTTLHEKCSIERKPVLGAHSHLLVITNRCYLYANRWQQTRNHLNILQTVSKSFQLIRICFGNSRWIPFKWILNVKSKEPLILNLLYRMTWYLVLCKYQTASSAIFDFIYLYLKGINLMSDEINLHQPTLALKEERSSKMTDLTLSLNA